MPRTIRHAVLIAAVLSSAAQAEPAVTVVPLGRGGRRPDPAARGPRPGALPEGGDRPRGAQLPIHHPFPRAWPRGSCRPPTDGATRAGMAHAEGASVVQMVDAWPIDRNDGTELLRLLVIDLVPVGQANIVLQAP